MAMKQVFKRLLLIAFPVFVLLFLTIRHDQNPIHYSRVVSIFRSSAQESPYKYCYKESSIVFLHLSKRIDHWSPLYVCIFKSAAVFNKDIGVCILTEYEIKPHPALSALPNLEIARLNVSSLLEGTPLAEWYVNYIQKKPGPFALHELSDALRYAYVYKFGGKYLDSDMLTLRKFSHLRNVTALQYGNSVNIASLFFDKSHPLMNATMNNFLKYFDHNVWSTSGPILFTSVIRSGQVDKTTYTVLDRRSFYPVHYGESDIPFLPEKKQQVMSMVNGSYAMHLWRQMHGISWKYWVNDTMPNNDTFIGEFCASI